MYNLFTSLTFTLIAFFLDSLIMNITGSFFLQLVSISAVIVFLKNRSPFLFFFSFFILGVESFFLYDTFGLTYCYLIPTFLIIHLFNHYSNFKKLLPYLSLILLLLNHALFTSFFKLEPTHPYLYLFSQISVNLLLLYSTLKIGFHSKIR